MIGQRLGPYEVMSKLGEGGMGEVYRATDTQLKRQVALKVLPAELADDAERLARFQREAEVLAALNHPHIAQIYGVERSGGTLALVIELVEGDDLSQRIAALNGRGLPLDEALPIARQIAEALEAAHEQGIIHRDLKPANIKVRDDGTVKVLDFGLAKALEKPGIPGGPGRPGQGATPGLPGHPGLTQSPTITSPALMTGVGMLLGTAAYMSPEQARGRAADKRADTWAFGVVLYEMLTGTRPFTGDDISETLASILRDTPDISRAPREVQRLLARCLEKDPTKRLRTISSWELLLDQPATPVTTPVRGAAARGGWITAALFAVLATGLAFMHYRERPVESDPLVVTLPLPSSGSVGFLAISPDGSRVVIRAGDQQLWIRPLNSPEMRKLTASYTTRAPFWSPDSRFVAYFDGAKLMSVPASGGPAQELCTIQGFEQGGTWSSKGVILFGDDSGLLQVNSNGGPCTPLSQRPVDGAAMHPTFLPDAEHFFYVLRANDNAKSGVYLASLSEPIGRRLLADTSSILYAPPRDGRGRGHLLFRRGRALLAQPFDQDRLETVGEPVLIADRVAPSSDRVSLAASVSGTGRLVWMRDLHEDSGDSRLVWLDANGKRIGQPVLSGAGFASLSPDGRFALTQVKDGSVTDDLILIDLIRGGSSRITGLGSGAYAIARPSAPVWSPDSTRLLFVRDGHFYLRDVASGTEKLVVRNGGTNSRFLGDWSRDGRFVFYTEVDPKTRGDIWYVTDPLGPSPRAVKFLGADSDETQPQLSPDGRWLLYSVLGATRGVYVSRFPSGEGPWKVDLNGGFDGHWAPDGKAITFMILTGLGLRSYSTAAFAVDPKGVPLIGVPRSLFNSPGGNATPDRNESRMIPAAGNRFLVSEYDEAPAPVLNLVTDWTRLAPGLAR